MSKGARWMLAVTVGLLASIGVGASAVHYLQEPYNAGFLDFPTIVALHVILGGIYLTLAPFQFVKGIRFRHLTYHRWQGNVRIFPRPHGWETFRKNPNRYPSHGWVLKLLSRTQPAVATTTKRNPMEGEAAMAEDDANNARVYKQPELPSDLKSLGDRLVDTWEVSGGTQGKITFEWIEGGFFPIQHVDLKQYGQRIKGIEVIGHKRP
jgi:hypothetical protein